MIQIRCDAAEIQYVVNLPHNAPYSFSYATLAQLSWAHT